MKFVEVVPFLPEHLMEIHLRDDQPVSDEYKKRMYEWGKVNHENGPGFTGKDGDLILCCAGLKVFRTGVAEAWMVMSSEVAKGIYTRQAYEQVRAYLLFLMKDLGLDRVQAWVRSDFPVGCKYAEMMGMEREGMMRKYDKGADCYLYAIVR